MGICVQKEKGKSDNRPHSSNIQNTNPFQENIKADLKDASLDPKFKNMPEWEGEKYKGFGIKRMKGYKCSLLIDELNSLREAFWISKKGGNENWKFIHQACVFDHIKGEEYLYTHHLKTKNGCINKIVDKDGNVYVVPNFCINDPYFEIQVLPNDPNRNGSVTIFLMDSYYLRNTELQVQENTTGGELKEIYSKKYEIDLTKNSIRFIFGGAFIKDDETLYQHKLKDKYTLQVLIKTID